MSDRASEADQPGSAVIVDDARGGASVRPSRPDMPIIVRELVRPSFTEWRATVFGPAGVSVGESAEAAYRELAFAMRAGGVEALHEKAYCAAGARDDVHVARRAALEAHDIDPTTPWAYVHGRDDGLRDEDTRSVSVQLWGISRRSRAVRMSTLYAGRHRGRLLEGPGVRMAWLGALDGSDADGALPSGIGAQAESMLGSAERALASASLELRDVVRTWVYARDLLSGYRELNAVRTAFYAARGVGNGPDARPFPASTGIQGRVAEEECVMDLLAVRAGVACVTPVHRSERQGPAFAYGSSFSRAMSLELEGRQTIFVSGTSSIAPDGSTLFPDDPERQSIETLLGIAALIEPFGATLGDVASGTLFTRDAQAFAAFDRVSRTLCLPELPLVRVRADVCRPELTVEIEAVVHVPASRGAAQP